VASAVVITKNLETGAVRNTMTNKSGWYLVLALAVGPYEVRGGKAGFQEAIRSGVLLVVDQEARVDLRLQVGAVRTKVSVTGDAAVVSTSTINISGLVGEREVKELPLNGRSMICFSPWIPAS
jgi:Carboxypeptidase regulatory-like domain